MDYADPAMLKDKVVWITASARGLGRAIAERLACCGASVAVHGRSEDTPREFDEAPSTRHVADEIAHLAGSAIPPRWTPPPGASRRNSAPSTCW